MAFWNALMMRDSILRVRPSRIDKALITIVIQNTLDQSCSAVLLELEVQKRTWLPLNSLALSLTCVPIQTPLVHFSRTVFEKLTAYRYKATRAITNFCLRSQRP